MLGQRNTARAGLEEGTYPLVESHHRPSERHDCLIGAARTSGKTAIIREEKAGDGMEADALERPAHCPAIVCIVAVVMYEEEEEAGEVSL